MLKYVARRIRAFLSSSILEAIEHARQRGPDVAAQIQLQLAYRRLIDEGGRLPAIRDIGFSCFSQDDEDGILWYLLALIGARSRRSVEICAGDGVQCNTANLLVNHGWNGLLVDGNPRNVERGRAFFAAAGTTRSWPPQFVQSWVTRDTINDLVRRHGFEGEIDVLSLDLDGVDYWIWEALEIVAPRIVVLEYQDILGPERSCTVPYADDFDADKYPKMDGQPAFAGGSLSAFVKLGRRKGYRLVGTNRLGFNAFFVRNDEASARLPEVAAATCFDHPKVIAGMRDRYPLVKDLPWVEV